jgi:hypothetical protein
MAASGKRSKNSKASKVICGFAKLNLQPLDDFLGEHFIGG